MAKAKKQIIDYEDVSAFVARKRAANEIIEVVGDPATSLTLKGPDDGLIIVGYPYATRIGAQPLGFINLLRLVELPELHCVAYVNADLYELRVNDTAPVEFPDEAEEEVELK